MPLIGVKLRELRRRRVISARTLAERSGISHSTISLIERDKMSPSVDTLCAILDALGTTPSTFFSDIKSRGADSPFYPKGDLVEIGQADNISYRMVGINHPGRTMMLLHETYAVAADSGKGFSHVAQEAGVVIRGAVELTVGAETCVLKPGDGYYFDSSLPHRFRNVASEPSEIISAITPPSY
jgi:transcriptional regulator with XRE-family HTH domain